MVVACRYAFFLSIVTLFFLYSCFIWSQLIAGRPVPVQVNYLVYPGTSGAPFLDLIACDRAVVGHNYNLIFDMI